MVLFATFGSLGDLHPYLAVGRALREHGVAMRLATSPDYETLVRDAGFEYAPMRPSLAQLGDPEQLARRLFDPLRGSERFIRELVMPFVRQQHEDLTRAADGADLLVSHPLACTLQIVAHERRLPWLSTLLSPLSLMSRSDPPTLPNVDLLRNARRLGPFATRLAYALVHTLLYRWEAPLRELRTARGLASGRTVFSLEGQHAPLGVLALFDPLLAAPQPDWPVPTWVCGAALHDGGTPDALVLGELQRFLDAGDAPLVFALGSAVVHMGRDFWGAAIDAARRLGRRALLLTGGPLAGGLPPGVAAFDYLPFSTVFPHAAAVVHQAGIGTLSLALRSGRPQLMVPAGFDQPDNARRAAELGSGRVLAFRRATGARLARELGALLADASAVERAREVALRLRAVDGAATAAQRIVSVLASSAR